MKFAPGEKVVHESTGECGLVVHSWMTEYSEDCYVVFLGNAFPQAGVALAQIPYVLRYAASSLRRAPG